MYDDFERACRIRLSQENGIGSVRFNELLTEYGSAQAYVERNLPHFDPKVIEEFETRGYHCLVHGMDKLYPAGIAALKNPPPVLYYRGSLKQSDQKAIAVVGTRHPTPYGISVTQTLVTELVRAGFTIISGLAFGIDAVAHETALVMGGRTLGFLASGIDLITPREHERLGQSIIEQGALLTPFSPGEFARKGNFVARNRLVAGMALGVVVTEGSSKSGTMITAKAALALGKPVWAVPGQINSPMSEAPLELIKAGATMITQAKDIVEQLQVHIFEPSLQTIIQRQKTFSDPVKDKIWQTLRQTQCTSDELIREMEKPTYLIMSTLTMMELAGDVKNVTVQKS